MRITPLIQLVLCLSVSPVSAENDADRKVVSHLDDELSLSVAERNYVLNSLARSLDVFSESFTTRIDHEHPDALLHTVERELRRTDVPHDGLSVEQRAFLKREREIQQSAVNEMKGKSSELQIEIFQTMQQTMQDHQKSASEHVKRIFGTHPLFEAIAVETQIDRKVREILKDVPEPSSLNTAPIDAEKRIRALADEIRALRR